MKDDLKVKAGKAVDDVRVAAHEIVDDAKVTVHNTLRDAGDPDRSEKFSIMIWLNFYATALQWISSCAKKYKRYLPVFPDHLPSLLDDRGHRTIDRDEDT